MDPHPSTLSPQHATLERRLTERPAARGLGLRTLHLDSFGAFCVCQQDPIPIQTRAHTVCCHPARQLLGTQHTHTPEQMQPQQPRNTMMTCIASPDRAHPTVVAVLHSTILNCDAPLPHCPAFSCVGGDVSRGYYYLLRGRGYADLG